LHTRWLYIILILPLILCISCGNIGIGPPEREVEKLYRRADEIYEGLLDGKIKSSRRNWNSVIRQFSDIVENHPKSRVADDAQYRMGLCYVQAHELLENSPQKAIKAFEYLVKRYPDSDLVDDARYWKAYAHSLRKDYRRAIDEYEKFADEYPQSEFHKQSIQQMKECRAKLGDQEKIRTETPSIAKERTAKPPPVAVRSTEESRSEASAKHTDPVQRETPPPDISTVPAKEPGIRQQHTIPVKQGELSYIEKIRFHSGSEFTRVTVDLSGAVKYKVGRLEDPDRLYIDIQMTFVDPAKQTIEVGDTVVKKIRAAQFDENTARIVLDLKQIQSYNVSCLKEPDRIVIDIYGSGDSDVAPPKDSSSGRSQPVPLVKQLGLKVRTIVIDPGHGGEDPGAVSKSGLQEKLIVLDVAKRLKKLLENKGSYQVHLTRETDVFIPLEKRTAFANQKGADIFISLHINSHKSRRARGIETYYLSLASDEEARATAALENASAGKSIKDLSSLLRNILRGAKVEESRELARTVQSQLCQHTGSNDRGIRRAPFIVLIGAESPSILVEMGFMSNILDESLLRSSEYKDKLARALMEAVEDYVKIIDQAS